MANPWRIQLYGEFKVIAPDGSMISLRSRKAKGVVALLALNRGIAVDRETLARDLWPNRSPDKQRQSLRQAIAEINRVFAPVKAIEADRATCRLSLRDWTCDAFEDASAAAPLVPEMVEPVFDAWRSEFVSIYPAGASSSTIENAVQILRWSQLQSPARGIELLYDLRELIALIPAPVVEEVLQYGLQLMDASDPKKLWAQGQLAVAQMWQGESKKGLETARGALLSSDPTENPQAWTNLAFAAATALKFMGKFERSRLLLHEAMEVTSRHNLRESLLQLKHCEAHCLGYSGDLNGAIAILRQLSMEESDPTRMALRTIHMGAYLALDGQLGESREWVEKAMDRAFGIEDTRLKSQLEITEAYLLIYEGEVDKARTKLADLRDLAEKHGFAPVYIVAIEGLAMIADEEEVRKSYERHALKLRKEHRLPFLPVDDIRMRRASP